MKSPLRKLLLGTGIVAPLVLILHVAAVCFALKSDAKEERIVLGGLRVVYAIWDYEERYGNPPARLQDLIPGFLDELPSSPEISKVDYRVSSDGKQWTLDIYWPTRRGGPVVYRRTNAPLNPKDTARVIGVKNGSYLLRQ